MAMRKIQSPKPEIIRAIQIKKSFYFEAYASDTPAFQNPKNIMLNFQSISLLFHYKQKNQFIPTD